MYGVQWTSYGGHVAPLLESMSMGPRAQRIFFF